MKAVFLWIILVCFALTYGYGQTNKKLIIHVFKENSEINTLLRIVLDRNTETGKRTFEEASKDSCLILYVLTTRDDFLFDVGTNDKYNINLSVNASINLKRNVGYFRYNKLKVFVCSDAAFSKFFIATGKYRSFSFLTKLDTSEIMHSKLQVPDYNNNYARENNSFVVDNPPALR
jgi:hypothetical protein